MAQSQRVLSGSRTRGSTASPSGSIIYSYQGINARTNASYFGSLLPRIGSGNRLKLYKGTKPLSENEFDDSLVINNDTADMRTVSGSIITTRIGFELERMTFGQPPTSQKGELFVDISGFDPVSYLHDPGHSMWPANLWNAGSLSDHEFDGVIEVFDIRREILGQVDLRYDGHAPRGSVTGPFSENPFGSTAITDKWTFSDYALSPFLDGPNEMSKDRGIDTPVLARISQKIDKPWTDPNSAMPFPGYQGLEREDITAFIAEDYHKSVYSKIYHENPATTTNSSYDLTKSFIASSFEYSSSSSLVAWWKMIGTPGVDVSDSSVNVFTGSFPNDCTAPTGAMQPPSTYIQASSWHFDGNNDEVIAITGGGSSTLNNFIGGSYGAGTLKSYSITFWVRNDGTDSGYVFVAGNPTGEPGLFVKVDSNGRIRHSRYGTGKYESSYTATGLAPANTWVHVVVSWDGKNYTETVPGAADANYSQIYINGVKTSWASAGVAASGLGLSDFADHASIGGKSVPPYSTQAIELAGRLADLAIFDKVLPQKDVKAMYLASSGSICNKEAAHEDPMVSALQALNGSSCVTLTNPIDHQANRGFYFGQKAGSIVYGDW